jgi:hypothetical protein
MQIGNFLALRFECLENMRNALLICARETMADSQGGIVFVLSISYDFIAICSNKFSVLTAIR